MTAAAAAPLMYAVLRRRQHVAGWHDPDRPPSAIPAIVAAAGVPALIWLAMPCALWAFFSLVDPDTGLLAGLHCGLDRVPQEKELVMFAAVARFALTLAWWPVVTFVVRPPRGHFRTALTETAWLSWALFVAVALLPYGVDMESREVAGWLFVLSLAAAGWAWWRYDRPDPEGRFAEGRCRGCAYDLTGNVTGACPECGRPVAFPDAAAEAPSQL